MPNPYVVAMTRAQLLDELAGYRDEDGLDHVADRDSQDPGDPTALSDEQ